MNCYTNTSSTVVSVPKTDYQIELNNPSLLLPINSNYSITSNNHSYTTLTSNNYEHINYNPSDLDVESLVANWGNLEEELGSMETVHHHHPQNHHYSTNNNNNNNNNTTTYSTNVLVNQIVHEPQNQITFLNGIQQPQTQQQQVLIMRLSTPPNNSDFVRYNLQQNNNNNNNYSTTNQQQENCILSKVDILNQVLQRESTLSLSSSSTSSSCSSFVTMTPSSFSSSSSSSLNFDQNQQDYFNNSSQDNNQSPENVRKKNSRSSKLKIQRKDEKMCCNVCGQKSSGFHYGSNTCEACKLFYRRTVKSMRKTTFAECKTKKCLINPENRANCGECRYKKCIAVGMAMNRSRFGRHTQQTSSNYSPNISESLCCLINNLKIVYTNQSISLNMLSNLILDFYRKTTSLLTSPNESKDDLEFSLQEVSSSSSSTGSILPDSPLSELSYLLTNNTNNDRHQEEQLNIIKLPNSFLVMFCVLFEIKISSSDLELTQLINQSEQFLRLVDEKILQSNKFVPILKIGIFYQCIRPLIEKSFIKDDPVLKRITDLMRSEFALFKYTESQIASNLDFSSSSSSCSSLSPTSTQLQQQQQQTESNQIYLPVLCAKFKEFLHQNMTRQELFQFC